MPEPGGYSSVPQSIDPPDTAQNEPFQTHAHGSGLQPPAGGALLDELDMEPELDEDGGVLDELDGELEPDGELDGELESLDGELDGELESLDGELDGELELEGLELDELGGR